MVHVGVSRSAGFWLIIKEEGTGDAFFAYGGNVLRKEPPRPGRSVLFTPLPPVVGTKLGRATEVVILAPSKQAKTNKQVVVTEKIAGELEIKKDNDLVGELIIF